MRILQLVHVHRDPNGGSAGVTLRLADEWREAGHQVDDLYASELESAFGNLGKRSRRVQGELLAAGAAMIGMTRRRRIDIVYATGHLGWILYPLLRLYSTRPLLIAASFGLEHEEKSARQAPIGPTARLQFRLSGLTRLPEVAGTIRSADGFVALTQFTGRRVARAGWKSESQILISGCGVPDECRGVEREATKKWTGTLAWCGTTIQRKGWNHFVSALAQCRSDVVRRVNVLGAARPEHEIREELLGAGVASDIEIVVHPELSRMEQGGVLAASDVFVSTSIYEGFHRALLEAMAIGLPVIATRTGFIEDQPHPQDICEMVAMRDATAVTEALHRLASDDSRRFALSQNARVFSEGFAWSSLAREQIEWMESLMEEREV